MTLASQPQKTISCLEIHYTGVNSMLVSRCAVVRYTLPVLCIIIAPHLTWGPNTTRRSQLPSSYDLNRSNVRCTVWSPIVGSRRTRRSAAVNTLLVNVSGCRIRLGRSSVGIEWHPNLHSLFSPAPQAPNLYMQWLHTCCKLDFADVTRFLPPASAH